MITQLSNLGFPFCSSDVKIVICSTTYIRPQSDINGMIWINIEIIEILERLLILKKNLQ